MKLAFEPFDGRSFNDRDVWDLDSNNRIVGFIASGRQNPGIYISLFDEKYTTTVDTFPECRGFVEGVEKVLNHMMSLASESNLSEVKPQYEALSQVLRAAGRSNPTQRGDGT
jgi:hypothetical protein